MKLSKETAIEMYNSGIESIKQFALENYPELGKKQLPKTWEELGTVSGFWVDADNIVYEATNQKNGEENQNIFSTKEEAGASIAMAMLSQLRKVYRDGWKPDWKNEGQKKYCIVFHKEKPFSQNLNLTNTFLSFPTAEIRDEFLQNFEELIIKAKPLLS